MSRAGGHLDVLVEFREAFVLLKCASMRVCEAWTESWEPIARAKSGKILPPMAL